MGALSRFTEKYFGVRTRAVPSEVSALAASVTLLARNNPDRLQLVVVNLSDTDLYVGCFRDVTATKGIFLAKSGGSIGLVATEDAEMVGYEWNVYNSAAAAKAVFVLEVEGE